MDYLVTFVDGRIGRRRGLPPLVCESEDLDDLGDAIIRYARPHLASRYVDVTVEPDTNRGWISCGVHVAAEFSYRPVSEVRDE